MQHEKKLLKIREHKSLQILTMHIHRESLSISVWYFNWYCHITDSYFKFKYICFRTDPHTSFRSKLSSIRFHATTCNFSFPRAINNIDIILAAYNTRTFIRTFKGTRVSPAKGRQHIRVWQTDRQAAQKWLQCASLLLQAQKLNLLSCWQSIHLLWIHQYHFDNANIVWNDHNAKIHFNGKGNLNDMKKKILA